MDELPHGLLGLDELRALRRDNPRALFKHLDELKQRFLFGVEDHCDADPPEWGGAIRVLLNRNLVLHLVPSFHEAMESREELPQLCVMPSEERADSVESTEQRLDDGEVVRGRIFWTDPDEFDVLMREGRRIAEEYPDWDLIPDSYFLSSELVQLVARVILEDEVVAAEREYDFRFGLYGGTEDEPFDDPEMTVDEMMGTRTPEADELGSAGDDDDPPLEGMRSHPVEWGGGD